MVQVTLLQVVTLTFFILPVGSVPASPWPSFRGPNGMGIAADTEIPIQWNGSEAILWKTTLPGLGNSSPVVWGDRVFVQSAGEDGKERILICLQASTGKILWTKTVLGKLARTHKKNSLASSTPATDGQCVYVLVWNGSDVAVHAYDFEGKHLWERDLGPFTSQHGPGTSPVTYQGKVFVANDQDGDSTLFALDAKTGAIAWQAPRTAFRACYSAPIILERSGDAPELIVISTAGITSYHPDKGQVNWSWNWSFNGMALRTIALPIYSHGIIFGNSGDGSGARHAVAVKVGGKGDVTHTNLVWEKTKEFPYVPTMLAYGDHLYFVNDKGIAACVEARTGEMVWTERVAAAFSASPILIDGKVYVASEDGVVYVFPAATSFKLLAKNPIGEPVIATPAVADNRLYIRGKNHLFCIAKPQKGSATH
jgi:outer membrane protein assembly factor BamB